MFLKLLSSSLCYREVIQERLNYRDYLAPLFYISKLRLART
jgi:hypothetical protein